MALYGIWIKARLIVKNNNYSGGYFSHLKSMSQYTYVRSGVDILFLKPKNINVTMSKCHKLRKIKTYKKIQKNEFDQMKYELMNKRVNERVNEQMNGRTDEVTKERTNERRKEWMNLVHNTYSRAPLHSWITEGREKKTILVAYYACSNTDNWHNKKVMS